MHLVAKSGLDSHLYTSAAVMGFGYGGLIPIMPAMAGNYFGVASIGAIFAVINIAQNVGMAIGPLLAGVIFDVTNSYYIAFLSGAVIMVIAFVLGLLLKSPRKKGLAI